MQDCEPPYCILKCLIYPACGVSPHTVCTRPQLTFLSGIGVKGMTLLYCTANWSQTGQRSVLGLTEPIGWFLVRLNVFKDQWKGSMLNQFRLLCAFCFQYWRVYSNFVKSTVGTRRLLASFLNHKHTGEWTVCNSAPVCVHVCCFGILLIPKCPTLGSQDKPQ